MKLALPTIKRSAVQSLATPDVSLPIQEGKARAAMLQAIGATVGVAGDAAVRYAERETKRQVQDASLYAHEQDTEFQSQYGGQEEFSAMDTDDDVFMDLADNMGVEDPKEAVPGHRIYPEWRHKKYQDSVAEAAQKITSKSARASFIKQHEMKGQSMYADDSVKANKNQIKYTARKTMEKVEKFMLNRDYGGARLAVETSDVSEEARGKANTLIDTQEQTDYFAETIEKRDIDVMTGALDQLIANDPKTTSNLDPTTQKRLSKELRTAINMEKTAINSGINTNTQLQLADVKSATKDIWTGKKVDMGELQSNYDAIKDKNPVVAREVEWTIKHQPIISQVIMSPPTAQITALKELKANTTGGREASYMIDQLEKAIEAGQIARRSDTTKWGKETGIITYDPIDYSSVASAQASLADRVKPILTMQRRYGTFTGFLEKDELIEFGSKLENAPNKLEYFAAINGALGEYAESFYEQLKEYNVGETASIAGQLMSWGSTWNPIAENILKGSNLRKTDNMTQLKMKDANSELDAFAVQRFGGIYTGNKKQQSLNIEAFKDIYAVTGNKEEAFQQLTGGTIDFNGDVIQAPVPGMSGWGYKNYLNDLAPAYWKAPQMKAYGFTPTQLQKGIIGGTLSQAGAARGVSYLETSDGSRVKQADGVTDFLFKFDPTAPTKSGIAADEWQEKREEIDAFRGFRGGKESRQSIIGRFAE